MPIRLPAPCAGWNSLPPSCGRKPSRLWGRPAATLAPDWAATAEHGETRDFLSGPAVTVPDGWEEPRDSVARTGAYLPANGLPTLVFVDAIW